MAITAVEMARLLTSGALLLRPAPGEGAGRLRWSIERCSDGALLGAASLILAEDGSGEVGVWLEPADWHHQDYGVEALRCLIDHAFDDLDLPALTTNPSAPASRALAAGMGFCHNRLTRANDRAARKIEQLLLVVAAALSNSQGQVLLAQRPPGKAMAGLWEFPGGKVDARETPEAALVRELKEELGIDVSASCLAPLSFASHTCRNTHLIMPLYICRVWEGNPTPREGQKLAWVAPARMAEYPMPPADRPLVAMLRDLL